MLDPGVCADGREEESGPIEVDDGLELEGEVRSFDYLVVPEPEPFNTYRIERKTWSDFVDSFTGRLDEQAAGADILIVERTALDVEDSDLHRDAEKHLDHLALEMPVIVKMGPDGTQQFLDYLQRKGAPIIRASRVRAKDRTVRRAILHQLTGINVDYVMDDGRTHGEAIEELVDWPAVYRALDPVSWTRLQNIGDGKVENVSEEILGEGPFRCAKCGAHVHKRPKNGKHDCGGVIVDEDNGQLAVDE